MRKAAFAITLLYALIIVVLTWPVAKLAFFGTDAKVDVEAVFLWWPYWAFLAVMVLCQFVLLVFRVKKADSRPATKKAILFPVITASLIMSLLVFGFVVSLGEILEHDALDKFIYKIAFIEMLLMWLLWALIFFRWGRKIEPSNLIERQCKFLFIGSVLELLVAVPTHVIARSRDYCCAGFSTFIGLALGLSVMIFSFGPGVLFLYIQRRRSKLRKSG